MTNSDEFILYKNNSYRASIGANIAEANGAILTTYFSAKVSIACKECVETKYWLSLLKDTDFIENTMYDSISTVINKISKIQYTALKSTRIKYTFGLG